MGSPRLFGATPWTWRGFWSRRASAAHPHARADEDAILDHVRGIFRAYLARDRAAIRRAHTDDWTGFLVGSDAIERGLAAYMRGADHSLATFRGTAFEITDYALDVRGDTALLYYTARYECRAADDRPATLRLRSLDVYRREPGGAWNQAGSHIAIVPAAAP